VCMSYHGYDHDCVDLCVIVCVCVTMDTIMTGRRPYTSDAAPITGEARNCSREKREPIRPVTHTPRYNMACKNSTVSPLYVALDSTLQSQEKEW
jgi:hypothetical protein